MRFDSAAHQPPARRCSLLSSSQVCAKLSSETRTRQAREAPYAPGYCLRFRKVGLADAILTAVYDNRLPGDECSIVACQK
jgi:hypothetical protein